MRGRVLGALAPIALALVVSGCGADGGGETGVATLTGAGGQAAASAAPSDDPHDKALKFAQCMRENGVDVQDPEPGKGLMMRFDKNTPREKVEAAQQACKAYAPSGNRAGGDSKRGEALRALAQCMRDNGVESYPDPEGGVMRITGKVGSDPDFEAAREKCQKESAEAGMGDVR